MIAFSSVFYWYVNVTYPTTSVLNPIIPLNVKLRGLVHKALALFVWKTKAWLKAECFYKHKRRRVLGADWWLKALRCVRRLLLHSLLWPDVFQLSSHVVPTLNPSPTKLRVWGWDEDITMVGLKKNNELASWLKACCWKATLATAHSQACISNPFSVKTEKL